MAAPPKPIRRKYRPTLKTKLEIIKRLEDGDTPARLGRLYKVNESTIRTIKRNADKIKHSIAQACPLTAKVASRVRNPLMVKMEIILASWLKDREHNTEETTINSIRDKALRIYQELQQECEDPVVASDSFLASKGWYENFRKRLKQLSAAAATDTATTDPIAVSSFLNELKATMSEDDYAPQQIFSVHITTLRWNILPKKNYTAILKKTNIDLKKFMGDQITLMLCNNADGSFKCKPLVVHKIKNPPALQGKSKHRLPVYLKWNDNLQITNEIFEDWFVNHFCEEIRRHYDNMNADFRCVLLLDHEMDSAAYLSDLCPNVKIIFIPENIHEAIKPIHQTVLNTFKISYLKHIIMQLHDLGRPADVMAICHFLQNYNMLNAIMNIFFTWDEMHESSLNAIWQSLCNDDVHFTAGFAKASDSSTETIKIINIGKSIGICGFGSLQEEDIAAVLEESGNLSEDTLQYNQVTINDEEHRTEELVIEKLIRVLELANQLGLEAAQIDPNSERSSKFGRNVTFAISPYRDLLKQKTRTF